MFLKSFILPVLPILSLVVVIVGVVAAEDPLVTLAKSASTKLQYSAADLLAAVKSSIPSTRAAVVRYSLHDIVWDNFVTGGCVAPKSIVTMSCGVGGSIFVVDVPRNPSNATCTQSGSRVLRCTETGATPEVVVVCTGTGNGLVLNATVAGSRATRCSRSPNSYAQFIFLARLCGPNATPQFSRRCARAANLFALDDGTPFCLNAKNCTRPAGGTCSITLPGLAVSDPNAAASCVYTA